MGDRLTLFDINQFVNKNNEFKNYQNGHYAFMINEDNDNDNKIVVVDTEKDERTFFKNINEAKTCYNDVVLIDKESMLEKLKFSLIDVDGRKGILTTIFDFRNFVFGLSEGNIECNVNKKRWILFIDTGQVFANFTDEDGRYISPTIHNWTNSFCGKVAFGSMFANNTTEENEIHGYSWKEVFEKYFSKVYGNVSYYKGEYINSKENKVWFFWYTIGYTQPKRRDGKKQDTVDKYSNLKILENETANKVLELVKNKIKYPVDSAEYVTINKLDSENNVIVLRRFFSKEKEDHGRIYIDKDAIYAAFKNRNGEWIYIPMQKKNSNGYKFEIDLLNEYNN